MAKTQLTIDIEKELWSTTKKLGVFGCFEVTIGFGGSERVDYMTYDTRGVWRCYEVKVSKSDFRSKAKKTFLGNFNYFVMTYELYEEVKDEIDKNIGVYTYNGRWLSCTKKPKRQELGVSESILKDSMIRSLERDYEKIIKSEDMDKMQKLESRNNRLEKELTESNRDFIHLKNAIYRKLGREEFRKFQDEYCM